MSPQSTLHAPIPSGATTITLKNASGFSSKGFGTIGLYYFSWGGKIENELTDCKCIQKTHPTGAVVEEDDGASIRNVRSFQQLQEYNGEDNVGHVLSLHSGKSQNYERIRVSKLWGHGASHVLSSTKRFKSRYGGDARYHNHNPEFSTLRNTWLEKLYQRNHQFVIQAGIVEIFKSSTPPGDHDFKHGTYRIQLQSGSGAGFSNQGNALIASTNDDIASAYISWEGKNGDFLEVCQILFSKRCKNDNVTNCHFGCDDPDCDCIVELSDLNADFHQIKQLWPNSFGIGGSSGCQQVIIPIDLELKDSQPIYSKEDNIPANAKEVSNGVFVIFDGPKGAVDYYKNQINIDTGSSLSNVKPFGIIGIKRYFGKVERSMSLGISLDELIIRFWRMLHQPDRSEFNYRWHILGKNYDGTNMVGKLPNWCDDLRTDFVTPGTADATKWITQILFWDNRVDMLHKFLEVLVSDEILGSEVLNDITGTEFKIKKNHYYQIQGKSSDSKRVMHVIKPHDLTCPPHPGNSNPNYTYLKSKDDFHTITRTDNNQDWQFIDDCLAQLYPGGNLVNCGEIITVDGKQFEFTGIHEARVKAHRPKTTVTFSAWEPSGGGWDESTFGFGVGQTLSGTFGSYDTGNYMFNSDSSHSIDLDTEYSPGHTKTNRSTRIRESRLTIDNEKLTDHFHLYANGFSYTKRQALYKQFGTNPLLSNATAAGIHNDEFKLGTKYCNGRPCGFMTHKVRFYFKDKNPELIRHNYKYEFLHVNFTGTGENPVTISSARDIAKRYSVSDILNARMTFIDSWNNMGRDYLRPDPLNSELTSIGEQNDFSVKINNILKGYNFPYNSADESSFSEETRAGVVLLKQMMYQMNSELAEILEIADNNGHMTCTLERNACQGNCGCYTWGCWIYHAVTATEGIVVQPLDWSELKEAHDNDSEFNPFETLSHSNLPFQESHSLSLELSASPQFDLVIKPGWIIHLQMDGFVSRNNSGLLHEKGYFVKGQLANESRSQFLELRGGDRICVGYTADQNHASYQWDDFSDQLAIHHQTKQQAETSDRLYDVLYFEGTETSRKIQFEISCITRPFATQPIELQAGWGHESGVSALAKFIQHLTDSMSLTIDGMFGISLSWNGFIELFLEQHFKVEIPIDVTDPVTYYHDYRLGFAAGRDVDLIGSTSFAVSLYGEKHVIPNENWGASLRCLLYETLAMGAAKWVIDSPRRPKSYYSITKSQVTRAKQESKFSIIPYSHSLEFLWDGWYGQLSKLDAKIKFPDRSRVLLDWTPNDETIISYGANLNNPIFDKMVMNAVELPVFVNHNASNALGAATSDANKLKQMKTRPFTIVEIKEDNFVGVRFGVTSGSSGPLIDEQTITNSKGNSNPIVMDLSQFDLEQTGGGGGLLDLTNPPLDGSSNNRLIVVGGVAKHSVGLNLNMPIVLPYYFRLVCRFQIRCTGKTEFSMTEDEGGGD